MDDKPRPGSTGSTGSTRRLILAAIREDIAAIRKLMDASFERLSESLGDIDKVKEAVEQMRRDEERRQRIKDWELE
jgi:hypothetical protein